MTSRSSFESDSSGDDITIELSNRMYSAAYLGISFHTACPVSM